MELPEHYDPDTVEQHVHEHWETVDAYERAKAATADGEPFVFVDGPPNTSGRLHCGTAWGKLLKDAFLRYYRMGGRKVRARPGYDTHGLPVERRVEAELDVDSKADLEEYGVDRFVADCREFVAEQVAAMSQDFADLGVWMDWDDPYRTMDPEYTDLVWTAFAELHDRGLLERDRRVLNTCPDCETSVAETRLSYETREATAAYVGFPLREREGWLLTWTTTPWTVTANQFVAVDADATYVAVETPERVLYVAEPCLDDALTACDVTEYEVRGRHAGEELVGWTYDTPLAATLPADSPARNGVVADAGYVELERTGLVHSAPGFGEEDFQRGRELDLAGYAPLDESGRFRHDGPGDCPYEGLSVDELRTAVLEDLADSDALLATHAHDHEYPRCPRCDSRVLYRATEQWVLAVSSFKEDLFDALKDTEWQPEGACENRFRPTIEDAPDWNVSRQRYWGTPVPVWTCEDCGDDVVVRDGADLAERADLDTVPADLHRPGVDEVTLTCPSCDGTARRDLDVLDVWFDSALASWASADARPPETPADWRADLLVEGHDQTRGWFLLQLYMGVAFADRAPYKEVLMHGFATLDGRAMSKSDGHVLRPDEVVEEYGRDALRCYLFSQNPTTDVDLGSDLSGVSTMADDLDVVWNVYRFALLYMDADDHTPDHDLHEPATDRTPFDDWVLSRLTATVETVHDAMADRRPDKAFDAVRTFLLEDVSRYYVTAVRDRVWNGSPVAYDVLGTVLHEGTRLLAPFAPFLAEELYQALSGEALTVHATALPDAEDGLRDRQLETAVERLRAVEEATATARQRAGRKRRWPVLEVVVETDDDVLAKAVRTHRTFLTERLNARSVLVTSEYDRTVEVPQPRMEQLGPAFGEAAPAVAERLREECPTTFPTTVTVDGEKHTVAEEMVDRKTETPESVVAVPFAYGTVYVETSLPSGLKREGIYRDLLRQAQSLRDDLDVALDERVVLAVETNDTLVSETLDAYREQLREEVRAERVVTDTAEAAVTAALSVDGGTVEVGLRRAAPTAER